MINHISADAEFVGGSEGESVSVFEFVFEGGARARNCGTRGREQFQAACR
jgi:hypothetical protein